MQRKTLIAAVAGVAIGIALVLALSVLDTGRAHHAPGAHRRAARRRLPPVGAVAIAARYLGTSAAHVRAATRSGRTLGELADSVPGRSAVGLIDAIVSARRRAIAERLRAGRLTSAQARRQLARLRRRATATVLRSTPLAGHAATAPN